jgi:hypothetical protein
MGESQNTVMDRILTCVLIYYMESTPRNGMLFLLDQATPFN